jgi:hypothetical protein
MGRLATVPAEGVNVQPPSREYTIPLAELTSSMPARVETYTELTS